jgi:Flp pilus assembly pilin Flp
MPRFHPRRVSAGEELGQTFVEYALVLAVIVVGVLLAVTWAGLMTVMQTAMDAVAGAV